MKLFVNIKELVGVQEVSALKVGAEMDSLNGIKDAFLLVEDGRIAQYGPMCDMSQNLRDMAENAVLQSGEIVDATGRYIMPAFCDSHTHLVYAGSREQEFTDKIKGLSYQEIARRGGGILNSAKLLSQTSEESLFRSAMQRAREIMGQGTGAVEIKSGYGLNPQDEIKMLRVIARMKEESPLTIKSTFLGAHAFPAKYADDHNGYVEEIINEMIPMIASEGLAEYIDAFCEEGFFSVEDTDRIFNAGMKYGLRPKVHANQMGFSGGVQVGVKYNAISVDHLESTGADEFRALKASDTIATILPGATFFLNMQYAPAR
jgi:imidazolonepropionase